MSIFDIFKRSPKEPAQTPAASPIQQAWSTSVREEKPRFESVRSFEDGVSILKLNYAAYRQDDSQYLSSYVNYYGNGAAYYAVKDRAGNAHAILVVKDNMVTSCRGMSDRAPVEFWPHIQCLIQEQEWDLLNAGAMAWCTGLVKNKDQGDTRYYKVNDMPEGYYLHGSLDLRNMKERVTFPDYLTITGSLCAWETEAAPPKGLLICGHLDIDNERHPFLQPDTTAGGEVFLRHPNKVLKWENAQRQQVYLRPNSTTPSI